MADADSLTSIEKEETDEAEDEKNEEVEEKVSVNEMEEDSLENEM